MTIEASYKNYSGSAAESYERYFVPTIPAPLAADLLGLAELDVADRIVDIACGTGIVARLAAAQLGAGAQITGVDFAPDMLEHAAALATASGTPIDWKEGNAEKLPFDDDSFDVALSQLGLTFVDDKAAAVSEMRRVLVPGGRLTLNVAGAIQPLNVLFGEALATHINPDLAGFTNVVFSMHDPAQLEGLLSDAGFSEISVRVIDKTFRLPAPADFLWQYINATPLGAFVSQAPPEAHEALERDAVKKWQPFVDGDGMVYDQPMVWATAVA
ncbi:MAG TPA: methyltransferase domain-containing protein [Acidimicrobiales bacterium]|jgi:ubiquinone/menaquinone biosynthesis C-methylase UbiE